MLTVWSYRIDFQFTVPRDSAYKICSFNKKASFAYSSKPYALFGLIWRIIDSVFHDKHYFMSMLLTNHSIW
jgi:hypothetical protein